MPASPITTAPEALARLRAHADPAKAAHLARFFKTGPGEYAEGDRFLGLTVPTTRSIAKACALPLPELEALLASEWHEARLLALLGMVESFRRGDEAARRALYESYLRNAARVDNWDLVDTSADPIVGGWLHARSRAPLTGLAASGLLWERRIAIVATFFFIKKGEPEETLRVADLLLADEEDLMHKATGWMLREVGKRCDRAVLSGYLESRAARMPRTMLRYAIEHYAPAERARYLAIPREAPKRSAARRR